MSFRPRIIPLLQLAGPGLVKTLRFKDEVYVGDPINAVKILNDFRADELVLVDITCTSQSKPIQFDLIHRIAEEAYMPVSYGGGINSVETASRLIQSGIEKLILGSAAATDSDLIQKIAAKFGSQAVMISIDVKLVNGTYQAFYHSGQKPVAKNLSDYLQHVINSGAGEILLQFIDKDGTMQSADANLVSDLAQLSSVPVVVSGGIASLEEMRDLTLVHGASAAAAGSLFTFISGRNSVLINYPDADEFNEVFQ